ncbi:MAG: thymidine phosphorylase [Limisphaerales bacterium]
MRAVDLIRKKRDGGEHSSEEIAFLVDSFARGTIPDYQISAWMMAVVCRGMSEGETTALTLAMMGSGQILNLRELPGLKVDKHSTGGVGDKTSLVIAPLVAAGGLTVPMITGRGLGHTGGTLDKLEAIPGFQVNLAGAKFLEVLRQVGCSLVSPTAEIVPADKKMYALRNLTGTVESPPLICASIMSKKLAEGIDALVLDVKTGSGAFMRRQADAEHLAAMMVQTGRQLGKKTAALITDMSQPLGRAVGNSLEVRECLEILRGERNPESEDLRGLCLELSAWMFYLGAAVDDVQMGRELGANLLSSGQAFAKFRTLCQIQGADPGCADEPSRLPSAHFTAEYVSPGDGYLDCIDCAQVGLASLVLGGGRSNPEDVIDHAVGLELWKKTGDAVKPGERIATVRYNDAKKLPEAMCCLKAAYRVSPGPPTAPRVLIKRIIEDA